jgi:hypothetical protein
MGGFRVPHPDETIKRFQQNLLQEINRKGDYDNGNSPHYSVLAGLLDRANRLTLALDIQRMRPKQWKVTGNKLKPCNKLIGLTFHAVADLLAAYDIHI